MLIKCYECGCEISDMAKTCPHCGAPIWRLDRVELGTKLSVAIHTSVLPSIKKACLAALPILILAASVSIIAFIDNAYYRDLKICWMCALALCIHCLLGGIVFLVTVKWAWGSNLFKWLGWLDFSFSYVAAIFMLCPIANACCFDAFIVTLVFGLVPLYLMYKFVRASNKSKSGALGWLITVLTIVLSIGLLIGANRAANDRLLMRSLRNGSKLSPSDRERIANILLKEACSRR